MGKCTPLFPILYDRSSVFTQSHADKIIGLQNESSLINSMKVNVLDTVVAIGRSSSTGIKTAS